MTANHTERYYYDKSWENWAAFCKEKMKDNSIDFREWSSENLILKSNKYYQWYELKGFQIELFN